MGTELFIDCFGSISQKKRQGVLKVVSSRATYELAVYDGKFVSVHCEEELPARGICERLYRAGKINEKLFEKVSGTRASISQLYDGLVGRNFVTHDDFVRAMGAYGIDVLHSLRSVQEPQFEFASGVIRPDPRLQFAVHPGQLLLDLEELSSDDERIRMLFGAPDVATRVRLRTDEIPRTLLGNEIAVWRAIGKGTTVNALMSSHLMSYYDLVQALLSLNDQGLLEVGPAGEDSTHPHAYDDLDEVDDLSDPAPPPAQIDETIDDVFARMAYDAVDSLLDGFEGTLGAVDELQDLKNPEPPPPPPAAKPARPAAPVRQAQPATADRPPAAPVAQPAAPAPQQAAPSVPPRVERRAAPQPEAYEPEDEGPQSIPSNDGNPLAEQARSAILSGEDSDGSLTEKLEKLNGGLLEPDRRPDLLVAVVCVLFLLIALVLPGQLEQWFVALKNYSTVEQ